MARIKNHCFVRHNTSMLRSTKGMEFWPESGRCLSHDPTTMADISAFFSELARLLICPVVGKLVLLWWLQKLLCLNWNAILMSCML